MPTVFIEQGFRFFFYSKEGNEPIHIHIRKENNYAKFWINPLSIAYNVGFNKNELSKIKAIIFSNQDKIKESWNEHFTKS